MCALEKMKQGTRPKTEITIATLAILEEFETTTFRHPWISSSTLTVRQIF